MCVLGVRGADCSPVTAECLGDECTEARVAEGQPAAGGDTVGLVLELLREELWVGVREQ